MVGWHHNTTELGEARETPPVARMVMTSLWRGLTLLLCIVAGLSDAKAQYKAGGACARGNHLAEAGYVNRQFSNHKIWLEKWRLTDAIGLETALPKAALEDHLRARFGCLEFVAEDLKDGFTSRDWRFASFSQANLKGANFINSTLIGANFSNADLEKAALHLADMRWAILIGTNLANAQMWETQIAYAVFEPNLSKGLPQQFEDSIGYQNLAFWDSPAALVALREAYKKSGSREIQRRITFAIETSTTSNLFKSGDYLTAGARYLAWKLPTEYELEPARALLILLGGILVFAIPYYLAMASWSEVKIWRVLPKDRIGGDGTEVIEPLRVRGVNRLRFALQFSVYSAFVLGWRDLSVGTWLSRLQAQEYLLRGSGWVRTISGVQSLLSVYLLAMWALTQFGRLFEG